jgi:hypothetical protein
VPRDREKEAKDYLNYYVHENGDGRLPAIS